MKAHIFEVLPEEYKIMRISYNVNIFMMAYKDLKKYAILYGRQSLEELRTNKNNQKRTL